MSIRDPAARRRMCEAKRRYPSLNHALGAAVAAVHSGRVRALRAYRCPVCRDWHLTRRKAGAGR